MSVEKPEDDAAEQGRGVTGDDDQAPAGPHPDEVDEADAAEQARAVELDEDEYR